MTNTNGVSTVSTLNLFMAGVWRVELDVYTPDALDAVTPSDKVVFFFCIQG